MDQDLLARFQAGDHSAVGDLYARYGGAVFTVAMSILRNRESAADATQQTFVKAWRNAGKFDTDREFAPWVYAIARRTAIDVLRSEKRRETVTISGEIEVIELPAGIEGAWEAFEVRQAVDQLPAEERIVIRLTISRASRKARRRKNSGLPWERSSHAVTGRIEGWQVS